MDAEYIKELKVAKVKCMTDTLFFTRYFFKKRFNRKFVVGDHHIQIAKELDLVIKGETKRLIINIAPRYGKTELAVKNFIARGLAINPSSRFIHLSYSDDLALDNSDEIRELVKSEDYRQLFPDVVVKPNSDSKKKWYTTAGGGVYATSAAGQVTGFGAGKVDDEDSDIDSFMTGSNGQLFGGALVIDDPIKPEDAESDVIRERINERYESTLKNRVNSRNTPIIIIMQRLHEMDLCGFLIDSEGNKWKVLSLPCIIDEDKDTERALWEFKHTLEELKDLKAQAAKIKSSSFDRQYQQNPKPKKGLMFPSDVLRYYKPDPLLKFESSVGYIDVADEGDDSLSGPIGRNIGQDIYITKVLFSKDTSGFTIPMFIRIVKEQEVRYVRVESNNMGAMYSRTLREDLTKEKLSTCQVYTAVSTQNKHTRIKMDRDFIIKHCLFLQEEFQDEDYRLFMKELTSYLLNGNSAHDDAPDSLSGLVIFVRGLLPHLYK